MITHRDRAFLLEHLDEVKRILCHEADDAHLLSIIKPRSSGKEIEMSDCRWLFRRHWLGIALLQAVGVVACGGAQTGAPVPDMEAEAMPAGLTSDFVSRPLPNPTSEVILNWAPLPDGREWGSTAGIDIGPDDHVWAYDRCGGGLDGGCESNPELDLTASGRVRPRSLRGASEPSPLNRPRRRGRLVS